jgi:hypothetical protein
MKLPGFSPAAFAAAKSVVAGSVWFGQIVPAGRLGRRHEKRRRLQRRCVAVGHHQHDAAGRFGPAGVESRDATLRNRAVGERGVDHALHWELGCEVGFTLHFERAVEARDRRANQAVLAVDQRVGVRARHPGVGCDLYRRFRFPGTPRLVGDASEREPNVLHDVTLKFECRGNGDQGEGIACPVAHLAIGGARRQRQRRQFDSCNQLARLQ